MGLLMRNMDIITIVKRPFLFFGLLCAVLISVVIYPYPESGLNMAFKGKDITYCFYVNQLNEKIPNTYVIDNGVGCMVYCDKNDADTAKKMLGDINAESVCLKNPCVDDIKIVDSLLKNAILTENCGDVNIYYCYITTLLKYVTINGQKINMQIAIGKNIITIGYPIILGEY